MFPINRSPTAYAYRFKTEEQICDNRGTLELDQQQQLFKQRAIDTIIRDIQTNGSWNNLASEIAPTVVICLPTWPAGQHLEVRSQGGQCSEFGRQATTSRLLVLKLAQGH